MAERNPTPYWDYLKLDRLLTLQSGLDEDEENLSADELHFIVVHQTFELWFKVVLREMRLAVDLLDQECVPEVEIPNVVHHLGRVNEIFKLGVHQWRVMETLPPQDFLAFRDKLVPASGFQSFQMREMEITMGLGQDEWHRYHDTDPVEHIQQLAKKSPTGDFAWSHLENARKRPTLLSVMRHWLHRTPIRGSGPDDPGDEEVVTTFVADYLDGVRDHHQETAARMARVEDRTPERSPGVHQAHERRGALGAYHHATEILDVEIRQLREQHLVIISRKSAHAGAAARGYQKIGVERHGTSFGRPGHERGAAGSAARGGAG